MASGPADRVWSKFRLDVSRAEKAAGARRFLRDVRRINIPHQFLTLVLKSAISVSCIEADARIEADDCHHNDGSMLGGCEAIRLANLS